jgi:glycosyltransferase involved in cell wall biosynthesis
MSGNKALMLTLEIIICTYNRAADLDRCLSALAIQRAAQNGWGVMVVDNNCSDATPEVVEAHIANGMPLGLHRLVET